MRQNGLVMGDEARRTINHAMGGRGAGFPGGASLLFVWVCECGLKCVGVNTSVGVGVLIYVSVCISVCVSVGVGFIWFRVCVCVCGWVGGCVGGCECGCVGV